MTSSRRSVVFAGFRFPREVIAVAVRWSLRYGLPYRTYLCRAVDQHGQGTDVLLSQRRDLAAAWRFCTRAPRTGAIPAEVTTDRAPAYPRSWTS